MIRAGCLCFQWGPQKASGSEEGSTRKWPLKFRRCNDSLKLQASSKGEDKKTRRWTAGKVIGDQARWPAAQVTSSRKTREKERSHRSSETRVPESSGPGRREQTALTRSSPQSRTPRAEGFQNSPENTNGSHAKVITSDGITPDVGKWWTAFQPPSEF